MNKRNKTHPANETSQLRGSSPEEPNVVDSTLKRAIRLIESSHYESAMAILRNAQNDPKFRNALGVCLMRLGHVEEAVRIYRALVLKPGCTWTNSESPVAYRINFATALLLSGHPSGCLAILAEIHDETQPTVCRLRAAIRAWETQLSWWQWLNWRVGGIEPADHPVVLDFPPGDFADAPATAEGSQLCPMH